VSVEHATFVLERDYPAPPARVFQAFADPELKRRWFSGPGWEWEMDFREGGRERGSGEIEGGSRISFDATYYDIVPDERIVYAYEMHSGGGRISVSVATFEIEPTGEGARLKLTEQGAFLDGADTPGTREGGTVSLLDALGEVLAAA
jgi:uncharacterized protein YndB with AHSA1/START domain